MKLLAEGHAKYFKDFLNTRESTRLFNELFDLIKKSSYRPKSEDGKNYNVNFGKVMFMDKNLYDTNKFLEEHWGPTKIWTDKLRLLKEKIQDFTGHEFQVCVLIYYPDGNSGVDFHSDYVAFGDTSIIPSISLGEERIFQLREKKSKRVIDIFLENGSLIIMGEHCQDNYEHSLPINPAYKNPRINLTFRKYGFEN